MAATAKSIAPTELASLEHAFATDPSSDAYRPLTEAYLSLGRFMEAMVVCKKGVKVHPSAPGPRVLLARIYAAQGKDRKALEELEAALKQAPSDPPASRMAGLIQLKLGEKEAGIAALRTAFLAAPTDPETLEVMAKWGLSFEAAVPEPPPAPASEAPASAVIASPAAPAPPAPRVAPASRAVVASEGPPVLTPVASPAPRPAPAEPAAVPVAERPAARRNVAYAEELASRYTTREYSLEKGKATHKRSRAPLVASLGMAVILGLVLAGWFAVSSVRKARAVEIDRLLRQTRELLEKDSYASYKEAAGLCERILERDPDAFGGHAYLAYVDAIRWGEHGESEGLRDDALKHLEAVDRLGLGHSHAYAARAYLKFYSGDTSGAIEGLRKAMDGPEGASALLHGVLGILEMNAGDLDGARTDLGLARQASPSDVRVTQMLAEQWRRRGRGYEIQAAALYDTALTRLAPDHVPSLLGKAAMLLDAGHPEEAAKRVGRVLEMGQGASPRQVALAHALRGSILHAEGKTTDGDAEEQQALALDPTNGDILDIIGRRKLRGGDVPGAAEAFQKAITLGSARLDFYVDLADALMRKQGGAREAIAALERASDKVGNARVTKLLGDAYRADGDLDRARTAYEHAIAMEKVYPEAHIALARVYRDRKDYPKALEELDRAVKEYGESAVSGAAAAWVEVAETEEARGAPVDAVEKAYTNALKADPQSCPSLYWLGQSRSVKKSRTYDHALALQLLQDYLKMCPKGAHAADAQRIVATLQ
jgi:cellulose synthase operon protein C